MKTFTTSGTGSQQTLSEIETDKIPVYDSVTDAVADLANLAENQIIATHDTGSELSAPVDTVQSGNMHAVSSNAVAKSLSYSTTEQATGGKWIDGKPIYRKVIEQNFVTGQTVVTHNLGISRYIDVRVFVGSVQYTNSYLTSQYSISVYDLNVNTLAVTCNSWVGSGYIILEYTKNTN